MHRSARVATSSRIEWPTWSTAQAPSPRYKAAYAELYQAIKLVKDVIKTPAGKPSSDETAKAA